MADGVLLLIERLLIGSRDVPVIEPRHRALLPADRMIFLMKLIGLLLGDLAILHFVVDPTILVRQPIVDLIATGMIAFPLRLGKRRGHHTADRCERNDESKNLEYRFHDTHPLIFRTRPRKDSPGHRVSI